MHTAAWLVLLGTPPGRPIKVAPFKLTSEAQGRPSRFEFELWANGFRWSYGFACTPARVEAEWLYRDAGGEEKNIFDRTTGDDDEVSVEIGDALELDDDRRQFWKFVAEGTRPAQLFLTEAYERNVKELDALLRFFVQLLGFLKRTPVVLAGDAEMTSYAAEMLRRAGTGIAALDVRDPSKEPAEGDKPRHMLGSAAAGYVPGPKIRFLHAIPGFDEGVFLDEDEESDGTRRLVDLSPSWFLLEKTDATVVIDELDRSLHTLLSRNLIERFIEVDPATSGQLIFTTHDTNLLDLTLLPYDSIWFVEKGRSGSSSLYSLAEFKPDQLAQLGNKIESGYLHGRFGGTPFLSNPRLASTARKGTP
jgi:hypothetical protein